MSELARDRILARLRSALRGDAPPPEPEPAPTADRRARLERLRTLLEAMRAEVRLVPESGWITALQEVLRARGLTTLLYAPETPLGRAIAAAWSAAPQ